MPEMQWWYARGEEQFGPVSPAELRRLASAGSLSAGDLVWREGLAEWAPASRLKGLFPDPPREPTAGPGVAAAPQRPAEAEKSAAEKPATEKPAVEKPPVEKRPPTEKQNAADKSAAGDAQAAPAANVANQETAELHDRPLSDPSFVSFTVVPQPPESPPVEIPPPPPNATDSGQIMPAASAAVVPPASRQRISYSRLSGMLTLLQASLWGICVLVILLGGLTFTWSRLHGKNADDETKSAVVYGMFFIGAYVVARAGQEISRLVLAHQEKRRN